MVITQGCQKQTEAMSILKEDTKPQEEKSEILCVFVCGAVKCPGVYELPKGSRIYEAIEQAGGLKKSADITGVNQAQVLEDEMQVFVPTKGEGNESTESGKVNINMATKEELMTLSGIGESKADSIIQYREQQGKFQNIEDIMNISGIKDGLFQKIKDYITV